MISGQLALFAGVLAFVLGSRLEDGPRIVLFAVGALQIALGVSSIMVAVL